MKFHILALAVAAVVAAPAFAAGVEPATAQLINSFPANVPATFAPSPNVVDASAFYSNVTTFQGFGFLNGGAAVDPALPANTLTPLVCDDNTYNAPVARTLTGYRFSVANLGAAAISARPLIRFFSDNANAPGTFLGGNNFNAITFNPGSVGVYTIGTLPTPIVFPGIGAAVKIWSCTAFDNNSGATGATAAGLNNLGVGLYTPVDRGTSADLFFLTTGNALVNNPPGSTGTIGGAVANFGFELRDAVTLPVELQSFEVK